jgi:tetratricopeptide (TPR) repeat protein
VVRPPAEAEPEKTEGEKAFEAAEEAYRSKDFEKAKAGYRGLIQSAEASKHHAKAYFGLARIAALEKDPELAQQLFEKTLETSPEAFERAWASVFLARLSRAAGEMAEARKHYQSALAVEGASDAARQAAEKELASLPPNEAP